MYFLFPFNIIVDPDSLERLIWHMDIFLLQAVLQAQPHPNKPPKINSQLIIWVTGTSSDLFLNKSLEFIGLSTVNVHQEYCITFQLDFRNTQHIIYTTEIILNLISCLVY